MSSSEVRKRTGRGCLLGNWVEERATIELDNSGTASDIQKHGHRDILTVDVSSKLNGVSTLKSAFSSPYGTRVRQKGLRSELLQKHLMKSISDTLAASHHFLFPPRDWRKQWEDCVQGVFVPREQVNAELTPQPVVPELYSVTRTDYSVEGFQCVQPTPSTDRDYRTDEAITFWRENVDKVQGMTAVRIRNAPFRRNASFTTPISERLDPSPEDYTDIEEM